MRRMLHRHAAMHFLRSVQPQHHTRGFTLIELIACIVILGILAAIIGPKFFDSSPFSDRGYVDEVASAIRYANNTAVGSGCDTEVELTATDYHVWQRAASGNACATSGGWSTPVLWNDSSGQVSGTAPANVTLSPATQIIFNAQGNVTSGNPTLTIGTHTINIDSVSGLVTVQ